MDAASISAIASSVSAAAAWFAFGTATRRAKKDWQRTTVLQCAVEILQLCQERHNREHDLLVEDRTPVRSRRPRMSCWASRTESRRPISNWG